MTWVLVGGLVLLAVLAYWWLRRPVYYENVPAAGIERFVSDLLLYFAEGSLLVVEHPGSQRFLQFVKYLGNNSQPRLHFSFPDADWSRPYFAHVAAALREANVNYSVRDTSEPICPRFLDIDGIADAQLGSLVARSALSAMGFGESDGFRLHFRGHHGPDAPRTYVNSQLAKPRTKSGES